MGSKVREIIEKTLKQYYSARLEWDKQRRQVFEGRTELNAKYINQALTQLKSFIPSEEEIEEILKDLGLDEMGTIPFPYNEISQAIHKRLEDIFK